MYNFKRSLKKKKGTFYRVTLLCSVDFSAHNDIRDVSFHLMLLVDFFCCFLFVFFKSSVFLFRFDDEEGWYS